MSIRVLVTGVGGGGHGEQICKALAMAPTDYVVYSADMNPFSKGLYQSERAIIIPPATSPAYVPTLLRFISKEHIQVLFHGSEPELRVMSGERDQFQAAGVFLPLNPERVIQLCMDKLATMDWLSDHGFCIPQYKRIRSLDDLADLDYFPVILKPSLGGGGSFDLFIAQSPSELEAFGSYLLASHEEFIAQEYVGTVDNEFTVGVLLDMDGGLMNSIAVRRMILSGLSNRHRVLNRTKRTELGPLLAVSSGISQGEIGAFPDVTGPCEEIAGQLGATGSINIQCRYWRGRVYVFEINPRFSGTTSLRAMVGYNEPDLLIRRHVLGEQITKRFKYRAGFILRGLDEIYVEKLKEE